MKRGFLKDPKSMLGGDSMGPPVCYIFQISNLMATIVTLKQALTLPTTLISRFVLNQVRENF